MSVRDDGRQHCDRCGADLGGGGVARGAVISDLDPEQRGMIRNFILCRDREEGEGDQRKKIAGCASIVLDNKALADYHTHQEDVRG